MRNAPAMHGSDHRPGGPDPIVPFPQGVKWAAVEGGATAPAVNDFPPRGVASACDLTISYTNAPDVYQDVACNGPWSGFTGLGIMEEGYYMLWFGVVTVSVSIPPGPADPTIFTGVQAIGYADATSSYLVSLLNLIHYVGAADAVGRLTVNGLNATSVDAVWNTDQNVPIYQDPFFVPPGFDGPILGAFNTDTGLDIDYTFSLTVVQLTSGALG